MTHENCPYKGIIDEIKEITNKPDYLLTVDVRRIKQILSKEMSS